MGGPADGPCPSCSKTDLLSEREMGELIMAADTEPVATSVADQHTEEYDHALGAVIHLIDQRSPFSIEWLGAVSRFQSATQTL